LPEADLRIYSTWFERTGFQGGLNWYRATATGGSELRAWSGKTLDQPALFLSGAADWGTYQSPGALARMGQRACTDFRGVHLVPGAGHWVQQEQPDATVRLVLDFLAS
jgi:pimeloyl-ACP methyl ester carboxylesterase